VEDAAARVAGPEALGRNLVVNAGEPIPAPWAAATVLTLDDAAVREPGRLLPVLAERLANRQRTVIELASPFPGPGEPPPWVAAGPPWRLGPTFTAEDELLHHLVWANSVDGTAPGRLQWRWAAVAVAAGAAPGDRTDVVSPTGTPLWCDGGPFAVVEGVGPVVPRLSLERGRLDPLLPQPCAADLAADQLAAVTHSGGAARIIAPAGSGKTRVLTERARHLLNAWGVPADAVTLVAFNKRAAQEMLERTPDLAGLQIRTLNALGLALLDGRKPFRPRGNRYTVIDEREVRSILDGLLDLPRRRLNTDPIAPWLDALSIARLGLRDPAEVEAEFGGEVEGFTQVYDRYREVLASRHALDFDEQILAAVEVLLREPDTRAAAQRSCRLLLVDEFQDLTPAHLLLVRLLAGPDGAVFGVGDDDQTIYGYTGATPEWLIGYGGLFPGAGNHPLEVNYRCPPAVVAAAGRLLARNTARVSKVIRPAPRRSDGEGGLVVAPAGPALDATLSAVQAALGGGRPPADIAVLTRVNASLAPVQVALLHAGVATQAAVGPSWLERTGVRAALAWVRLAVQPDRLGARDVAETARRPSRGMSAKVVEWMGEQRSLEGLDRLAGRLRDRDADKVGSYAADVRALATRASAGATSADLFCHVRDHIGLDDAMDVLDSYQRTAKGSSQNDDLDALVSLATLHPEPAGFGRWLAGQLAHPGHPDGVMLATVHAVKGREWPEVIVHDASSGLFPHRLAIDEEEERRVFHVAITRCSSRVTVVPGPAPSPFVAELTTEPAPGEVRPPAMRRLERERVGAKPSVGGAAATRPGGGSAGDAGGEVDAAIREALRQWRADRSRQDRVPAYVVFHDATLDEIARRKPASLRDLARISGIGPTKLERYGDEVLAVVVAGG
jgi:DNA helicase-2/ATP-dependent DNA helicase PcrA